MRKNRLVALLLVVAVLALPLAACGKKNDPVPPSNPPPTYPGHYPSQ
ncbi:MAG: hypothetical protein KGI46_12670 [Alphaproteobacteria bacterium]|nr:hypothetical protein [Alphaproteobacteria bacterium]MDE1932029.1 hypothetical protein [Alphaproteobacteria bacterium]